MADYKMNRYDKLLFFRQLSMIYDSELSAFEGIDLLMNKAESDGEKDFFLELKNGVLMGETLSELICKLGGGIERHELKMIELGETSGRLPAVLSDMSDSIERELEVESRLKSAFRYPIMLAGITLLVLIVIIVAVVPVFHEMIIESGASLNAFADLLFSFSLFLKEQGIVILACLFVLAFGAWWFFKKTERGIRLTDYMAYRSVFTRKIKKNAAALSFAKNLAILVDSGVDFSESLYILEQTVNSQEIKNSIANARAVLDEGGDISDSLNALAIFPKLLVQISGLAAKSGHLVVALKKAESLMLRDLDDSVENLSASVEPVIIIALSLIVGAVLISSIIPIFDVLNSI